MFSLRSPGLQPVGLAGSAPGGETDRPMRTWDEGGHKRLKPSAVGLWGVLFMALATAAPITAMTGNVPIAVGFGNGIHAPAGFLVATAILTIFTVGYAAMSRHITAAGAFYGYVSHGLGQSVGMATGLMATVAYVVFEAALIGIFSSFLRTTIVNFGGPTISWIWFGLAAIVVIGLLGYFHIELSGKLLAVFLVTEVLVLLVLAMSVLVRGGGPGGLVPGALNPIHAFQAVPSDPRAGIVGSAAIGLFFAFWSWVGFETTAVYGEESKNPKRIVPRAVMIAVVAVGVLYTFVSWMAVAGNGGAHAVAISRSSNPFDLFFGLASTFVSPWMKDVYQVLIVTGSFACALAFHNTASRYLYALGREAPGPSVRRVLGATHDRHQSPHVASVFQTVITVVIVLSFFWFAHPTRAVPDIAYSDLYGLMAILGTLLVLICQTLCSLSVVAYFHVRREHPETAQWWRTLLAPLIGAVGMAYVVFLLFENLGFAAGAAASTPVYRAIPWIVGATAVVGLLFAAGLRVARPERYRLMGRTVLEDSVERTAGAAAS